MSLVYAAVALLAPIFTHAHAFAEAKVAIRGPLLPSTSQTSLSDDIQQLALRQEDELLRKHELTDDIFALQEPLPSPSPDRGTPEFGSGGSRERDDGGPPIAAIVGGSVAGVVVIGLVLFLTWFVYRSMHTPVVDDDPTAQLQPHHMPEGDV